MNRLSKMFLIIVLNFAICSCSSPKPALSSMQVNGNWISLNADDGSTYRFNYAPDGSGLMAIYRPYAPSGHHVLIYQFDWRIIEKYRGEIGIDFHQKPLNPEVLLVRMVADGGTWDVKLRIGDRTGVQRIQLGWEEGLLGRQIKLSEAMRTYDGDSNNPLSLVSEDSDGDFINFFHATIAELGSPKPVIAGVSLPQASWIDETDSTGVNILIDGLTVDQLADFFVKIYGEPTNTFGNYRLFEDEKLSVSVWSESKGTRVIVLSK